MKCSDIFSTAMECAFSPVFFFILKVSCDDVIEAIPLLMSQELSCPLHCLVSLFKFGQSKGNICCPFIAVLP